jgi:toxin ParE1/3/4
MPRIFRTKLAEQDYREIWHHIGLDSPDAADRLLRRIDAKLDLYARHPGMGTSRSELSPGLRSFSIGSYLIFYRPVEDGIELVRVLHGRRELKRHFPGEDHP